jgi:N-acetylated-alpha-linked acidic dipeptidase
MHLVRGFNVSTIAAVFLFAIAASAAEPRQVEQQFDALLKADDYGPWLKELAAEANHVGSPHNKKNAEFILKLFRDWGWQARIETYSVLYPTPRTLALEMVAPMKFTASLKEPPIEGDATSSRTDGLPPYNAYGADGDVTSELVYVNYGMDEDYKELYRHGVDVKGKIVIVRYGSGWRGLKPKLAYEHGAVGCLIYSDPKDDGYARGDVYPKGGWRPAGSTQRGSVLDMPIYPGDPLTPGVAATKDAKRLAISEAKTILKIPVMPISYADAQPLLAAIEGHVAPESWRGSLPITYKIGPGPAKVHLKIESDWNQTPLYNVIARIPGAVEPDKWVIRGNHRDGWVQGAWDPLSGTIAMLEEAKAIGALVKSGWKPARTIVYASWDGEEVGLLGSTEWVEEHADELLEKAVLYVNSDTNTRGFLSIEGSQSLQHFINEVAADVNDPETHSTVQARLRANVLVKAYAKDSTDDEKTRARIAAEGLDMPVEAMGSGSDYTPFIQHLGITTLGVAYEGEEDQSGVYHSLYDSFDHYVRFGDPGFAYALAESKTVGRVVLRMATAPVLPLQFQGVADAIDRYVKEIHKLADDRRKKSEELAKLIDQNAFTLAADPTRPVAAPERLKPVPFLELAPLDTIIGRLQKSAKAYDAAYARLTRGAIVLSAEQRAALNELLQGMERALTSDRGLPNRSWFRHFIYAPGVLTGYGVKTLPGVREAIEGQRYDEANEYSRLTADVLEGYCQRLDRATALLATTDAK